MICLYCIKFNTHDGINIKRFIENGQRNNGKS